MVDFNLVHTALFGAQQPKLRHPRELDQEVSLGLPKESLRRVAELIMGPEGASSLVYRVVPRATFARRVRLSPEESARTERLARVLATAMDVLGDRENAVRFLTCPHTLLEGRKPLDLALTELGARRVEGLLWNIAHGVTQ
jgi:putative toxin-antitoxin system antitoxin component (TIGR02293 family)